MKTSVCALSTGFEESLGDWGVRSHALCALSDDDLLARLTRVVAADRRVTAEVVAHIAEVDRRKLYTREACSSMFTYCTERLGLSADATQKRIQVARASRRFPQLLEYLAAGRVHLSGLNLLSPHLEEDNVGELLERAAGRSKREIEAIVAEIAPRPDVTASIRRLPRPRPPANDPATIPANHTTPTSGQAIRGAGEAPPPANATAKPASRPARPSITPLSPARYKVQFTASQELRDKIERARELLSHRVFGGDLAEVFDRVLSIAVAKLERERFALTDKPVTKPRETAPGSRHVPAELKRRVHERDEGQCTYVDGRGNRCSARTLLEYHHIEPHALGGPTTFENICLRCRSHNGLEAEEKFGADFMAQKRLFA